MNRIVASAQISLMDYNDAIVTGSMPTNPEKDMLWLNTSVNPHIMKQYTGSEWIIVGELDPEYTEKLEVITGNITNLELTLGNMADDGKLDYGDRQEIVDKLLPIIGYLPTDISVSLKTVSQLDTDKKGSFYQLRQAAQNAGIVTSSTAYIELASAWNALRAYLGGLDPKPWDLSTVNQDAVTQVDKGTFRTHWLNYYNAEYTLATATTQILHSAISTINTTTLPAMRDSALSSAEKTAIKQSLIILSSEKTAMDGEIIGLKANPKLENQTPLNEAKSAYDTSYTGVTTAINAVLAVPTGTLIPSTLILEVENAVSSYSAKLSLLKKAMQDSQTAIAEKVSGDASRELSDSLEGYVDKITYGQDVEDIQNQVDAASDNLRHFVEVKGLDRAIRFGMLVDYQSFATPTANWLYFCKIQTNTDDFREELVDKDGSIFDYTTQREIKVPKQALDLRGVAEGTTGYLAFDTRNQLIWFIHYQRNYTNTTNQKTGIVEKIPSSEYWIKWNPGKTGHNTQLVLDESVYIVGEIER